jgi:glycine dehydrogenase subunit 1
MVTAATIYMSLLGFDGLATVARRSHANTTRLVDGLCAIGGVERLYDGPYFHEVALRLDRPVAPILAELAKEDILGGFDLSDFAGCDALLVCATETKSTDDIDGFVAAFADVMASM